MDVMREKLCILTTGIRNTLIMCKVVSYYASLLLFIVGFTFWFDFRPIGMICAMCLGIFWCFHCATLQLQKSVRLEQAIAKIGDKLEVLRADNPIKFRVWFTSAVLIVLAPFHFLPWWIIFVTVLALAFYIKWKYEIKLVLNHESVVNQESQLDIDVQEFLPEIDEMNLHLLKEIDEQCNDCITGSGSFVPWGETKNAIEQDEDIYLNMLIPEINSNDFESADQSASSSDEMFCPEPLGEKSSVQNSVKSNPSTIRNGSREKQIDFKISHFNANSSSDSDDNISRGLCFGNNDDDIDSDKRLQKPANVIPMGDVGPRYDMTSVSNLASNVLLDTVYQHILDATLNHHQTRVQPDLAKATGCAPQNPIFASISNTIRSMQMPTCREPKNEESTDEDVDSDFEILNSEELKNL